MKNTFSSTESKTELSRSCKAIDHESDLVTVARDSAVTGRVGMVTRSQAGLFRARYIVYVLQVKNTTDGQQKHQASTRSNF